jgi:hypothetical protein
MSMGFSSENVGRKSSKKSKKKTGASAKGWPRTLKKYATENYRTDYAAFNAAPGLTAILQTPHWRLSAVRHLIRGSGILGGF